MPNRKVQLDPSKLLGFRIFESEVEGEASERGEDTRLGAKVGVGKVGNSSPRLGAKVGTVKQ